MHWLPWTLIAAPLGGRQSVVRSSQKVCLLVIPTRSKAPGPPLTFAVRRTLLRCPYCAADGRNRNLLHSGHLVAVGARVISQVSSPRGDASQAVRSCPWAYPGRCVVAGVAASRVPLHDRLQVEIPCVVTFLTGYRKWSI